VRVGGRGRTILEVLTVIRSSTVSSSFVTGSLPFSAIYASTSRLSKTLPGHVRRELPKELLFLLTRLARDNWILG
jgi:hypothetical protein